MAELIPWVVVAIAGATAFGLFFRARAAGGDLASAHSEITKLRGELDKSRDQLAKSQEKQRRSREEQQTLRRKLDKTKRRVGQETKSGAAGGTRIAELEEELEAARQSRDSARQEAGALAAELRRLREAARQESDAEAEQPLLDNASIRALTERAESVETALEETKQALTDEQKERARAQGKLETAQELYVSIRSELDVKKDRLRTQQEEIERLRALKVAIVDAPQVDPGAGEGTPVTGRDDGAIEEPPAAPAR